MANISFQLALQQKNEAPTRGSLLLSPSLSVKVPAKQIDSDITLSPGPMRSLIDKHAASIDEENTQPSVSDTLRTPSAPATPTIAAVDGGMSPIERRYDSATASGASPMGEFTSPSFGIRGSVTVRTLTGSRSRNATTSSNDKTSGSASNNGGAARNTMGDPSQYPLGSAMWRRALQEQQQRQPSLATPSAISSSLAAKTTVAKAATSGPAVRARAAARESRRRQIAYMHSHGQQLSQRFW